MKYLLPLEVSPRAVSLTRKIKSLVKYTPSQPSNSNASRRVGIIAGVGDRRDEDTIELGRLAGEIFDEIIIRQDKDSRGKSSDEINQLLVQGIRSANNAGDKPVHIIPEEMRAIAFALENPERDSLITIFSEEISEAIKLVENFKVIHDRQVLVD